MSRRLGRRGTVLLMLGTLWFVQGLAVAFAPDTKELGAEYLIHLQLPLWFRVGLWCVTGLMAIVYAFLREPPGKDGIGFMALVLQPLLRTGSYGYGFLVYAISHATSPMWHVSALVFSGFALALWYIKWRKIAICVSVLAVMSLLIGVLHPDIEAAGYPRGLIGFATWGTIAGLIMVISGWADPRNRVLSHRLGS